MIIRLTLCAIVSVTIYTKWVDALPYGDDNDWGYSRKPSSLYLSSSQIPLRYSSYTTSSFSPRPSSFLETQFHTQLPHASPPPYYQQDNSLYSGSNPFPSGGLSHAFYQNSAFNNYPSSSYDDSNYQAGSPESLNYPHLSKPPSMSNPVPQDMSEYNQMSSTQNADQALTSLAEQFNNHEGETGGLTENYQPPEEQFSSPQDQFSAPPLGQVSSPSEEQFSPQNQLQSPPSSPKPPLQSGPGGETILLAPEQVQILRQVMPELGIENPNLPITVTPEQLKKLQQVIARTNFQLPPGFPPEFVANMQAAAKAPPKRVHKATAVRSRNMKDEDPEEFIRNLASYKKAHGIDPALGDNPTAQEVMMAIPGFDPANL